MNFSWVILRRRSDGELVEYQATDDPSCVEPRPVPGAGASEWKQLQIPRSSCVDLWTTHVDSALYELMSYAL